MINLKGLNKNQYQAVTRTSGYTLVLAGAGTGKTRVLTFRIGYLIERKVHPGSIFAFTFTNKAANEMKARLKYLNIDISELTVSTFHSFCYGYLSVLAPYLDYKEFFIVIDDDDKLKVIRKIINENNIELIDTEVVKIISAIKNQTKYPFKSLKESFTMNFVFHRYQEVLKSYNKMDLDDLVYQFYKLLKQEKYFLEHLQKICQYILVDECQDINNIQYEILLMLTKKHNNLFLVGDQDQCIYAFRGSNMENINHFIDEKNAKVIKLEENYRSNENILEVANTLIKNNKIRIDKILYTTNRAQKFQVIRADLASDKDEAIYVTKLIKKLITLDYNYSDIAVLYRNHFISTNFEKEFMRMNIPYVVYGSFPFFKHKEIKTLMCYYQFIINNDDDITLREIYNTPSRGIGLITFRSIEEIMEKENITLFQAMSKSNTKEVQTFVSLIEVLTKEFQNLDSKTFIEMLLSKIKYHEYIVKLDNSKAKINRLNEFIKMIEELDSIDNKYQSTIHFFNQLMLSNNKNDATDGFVKLMTIHQSKGLEFKVVIVAGCNEGIIPSYKNNLKTIEEERRIFYVAITRAKERLYLLSAKRRFINGKLLFFKPSTFLENINPDLLLVEQLT